jgi:hypothetical protein
MSAQTMKFKFYYTVATKGAVRFESVYQVDCERFARDIFAAEKIIAEIHEVERE